MGTRPSLRPVYDDKGNQIGTIESGPTESQIKKGVKPKTVESKPAPKKETVTTQTKQTSKPKSRGRR